MAPRTPKDPTKAAATRKPARPKAPGAPKAATAPVSESLAVKSAKPAKVPKSAESKVNATVRLRDLVAQVAAATGTKKPAAKKSVEAVLTAISSALGAGSHLTLPPLGKLRVARTAGNVLTLKLRTGAGEKRAAKPLADDGEDD